jgi:hypothetical protein
VSAITRGSFHLELHGNPQHHLIGITWLLLMTQLLAQLLLVSRGALFGQIMFLSTLFVSWVYNSALCSLDQEGAQTTILKDQVLCNLSMKKFILQCTTSMVVFILLVVAGREQSDEQSLRRILDDLIPNDTAVWRLWKHIVLPRIAHPSRSAELRNWDSLYQIPRDERAEPLEGKDLQLLATLLKDASEAYSGYESHHLQCSPSTITT